MTLVGLETAVFAICALFFLFTAAISGWAPARFAASLGLAIADPGGAVEIRAQYAGFFLAAALVCIGALLGWVPVVAALVVIATIFGGLISGRLAGLAANGGWTGLGPTILSLYAIDAVGFGLALACLTFEHRG